ncbi:hypothetical protein IG631_14251 [Alternaria alternata]|nr:hypothetical protein IG631_14251 [Alternaria alternata]
MQRLARVANYATLRGYSTGSTNTTYRWLENSADQEDFMTKCECSRRSGVRKGPRTQAVVKFRARRPRTWTSVMR